MARIHLLVHVEVEVDDADVAAYETPESCTPTALRRHLQHVLGERRVLQVPQTPAVGAIDVEALVVEWPGDHALRVLSRVRQGLYSVQELGLGTLEGPYQMRGRPRIRREPGG